MASETVLNVRHVLAVKDLARSTDYFVSVLDFKKDFSLDGWEFLSFGRFRLMLGECPDDVSASETNSHSYFAYVLVDDADSLYSRFESNGATFSADIENRPWGLREFCVTTPDGHRIVFAQEQ